MTDNGALSGKQQAFASALAQGMSVVDAAASCQISPRTAHRWKAQPSIKQAIEDIRREAFTEQLHLLRLGMRRAMTTLAKHISAEVEVTPATQLQAVKVWIESALQVHHAEQLERRIEELEQLIRDRLAD